MLVLPDWWVVIESFWPFLITEYDCLQNKRLDNEEIFKNRISVLVCLKDFFYWLRNFLPQVIDQMCNPPPPKEWLRKHMAFSCGWLKKFTILLAWVTYEICDIYQQQIDTICNFFNGRLIKSAIFFQQYIDEIQNFFS